MYDSRNRVVNADDINKHRYSYDNKVKTYSDRDQVKGSEKSFKSLQGYLKGQIEYKPSEMHPDFYFNIKNPNIGKSSKLKNDLQSKILKSLSKIDQLPIVLESRYKSQQRDNFTDNFTDNYLKLDQSAGNYRLNILTNAIYRVPQLNVQPPIQEISYTIQFATQTIPETTEQTPEKVPPILDSSNTKGATLSKD